MIFEILLIAVLVTAACTVPGVFLVLRKMSLLSDAISHSVLFGIVISFFLVNSFHSPLLVIGAVATGMITVVISEMLLRTGLLKEDASIGLVFPALFSVGVILISKFADDIHLDTDAVLMGEIAMAPFDRFFLGSFDAGPVSAWVMGGIALLNFVFLGIFYKELKISTFDAGLSAALGFSPAIIHYSLMILVSITTVGAFDSVGSILVVALMIAPAASAYLLTDKLSKLILYSLLLGIISSAIGVLIAFIINASIAGSIASACGLMFLASYLASPKYGIISKWYIQRDRKLVFASYMVAVHLLAHEGTENEEDESEISQLTEHLRWPSVFAAKVVATGIREHLFIRDDLKLRLTPLGRETARSLMEKG
jgi:manganese/zinc/iron transport system permease protein